MKQSPFRREEGQSTVMIAMLAIALVAFMGLLVDGGRAFAARRQSQNASDAGAFAGARRLTSRSNNGPSEDSAIFQTIVTYALANGASDATDVKAYYMYSNNTQGPAIGWGSIPGTATGVRVNTMLHVQPFLMTVLWGSTPVDVQTVATMQSGLLTTYDGIMPLIIQQQNFVFNKEYTLMGEKTGPGDFQWLDFAWPCHNPSEQDLEDALAWPQISTAPPKEADPAGNFLDPDTDPGGRHWICGGTGIKAAAGPSIVAWITKPEAQKHWIIPVFDVIDGTGSNLKYHIVAFAEFIPSSYYFSSSYKYPSDFTCPSGSTATDKCVRGKFVKFAVAGHGDSSQSCNKNGTSGCAIWLTQ